ncbi:Transformer-2-like protein beta, partial [Dinothrombium tinctorium]
MSDREPFSILCYFERFDFRKLPKEWRTDRITASTNDSEDRPHHEEVVADRDREEDTIRAPNPGAVRDRGDTLNTVAPVLVLALQDTLGDSNSPSKRYKDSSFVGHSVHSLLLNSRLLSPNFSFHLNRVSLCSPRRERSPYDSSYGRERGREVAKYRDSYYRRSHSRSPMSSRRRHQGSRENPPAGRCLGIFGLSIYTQERDLHDVFSKYGPIDDVQIVYDAQTGRSRGFCFVYFKNTEDAKVAKERCNGIEIDGRKIRVDYSITQRAHTPTPGIYMGKPTYPRYRGSRGGDYYSNRDGGYTRDRSPSPYYRERRRYSRSRSRSYSP